MSDTERPTRVKGKNVSYLVTPTRHGTIDLDYESPYETGVAVHPDDWPKIAAAIDAVAGGTFRQQIERETIERVRSAVYRDMCFISERARERMDNELEAMATGVESALIVIDEIRAQAGDAQEGCRDER